MHRFLFISLFSISSSVAWGKTSQFWSGTWSIDSKKLEKRLIIQNENDSGFFFVLDGESEAIETIPNDYGMNARNCAKGSATYLNDTKTKAIYSHPKRPECSITFEVTQLRRHIGVLVSTDTESGHAHNCSEYFYCKSYGDGNFNDLSGFYTDI